MENENGTADELAAEVGETLRALSPTRPLVGLLVTAGKEYVWGATLRALLDQQSLLAKCHFHCLFDGEARVAELWWDRFCVEAEAVGATTSSETVELEQRHHARWVNVGTLREIARQRFLESDCTHLWWVECDCPPPPNALSSLCGVNQPLVTAAVACRGNCLYLNHLIALGQPGNPSDIDGLDLRDDEPPTLLSGSLGCCLMERRGLEQCAWEPGWQETEFIGGEDGYIQGRIKEAVGCELLLDPHVLVPHCDVVARDPDGVIGHVPVQDENGHVTIERREWNARETAGMWRPRVRPWTFVRPWRNKQPGDEVPEDLRELIAERFRWAYTCDGPDLPPLDLAQHEVLLPGETVRISGRYQAVTMDGSGIGNPISLKRGESTTNGEDNTDVAGFDLTEIEVIDECHISA